MSDTHIGAVLEQSGQPVVYFSCKLSPMECNYPVTDHELLAIFLACQQWRCYLHGAESTVVYTDHKAGASVYPATVKPPLDMLGGKAS